MKGIVVAGDFGTGLYPLTIGGPKQLLPIYDKPMIYYPLSVLMLANIRDILIITKPEDQAAFQRLLGDGSQFGISLSYAMQSESEGLAQAFIIGEGFIGGDAVALVLGDNIFYGPDFTPKLQHAASKVSGASVFAYQVKGPQRFSVVDFDASYQALSIEEKPERPKSNWAVTGLYFYDNTVIDRAKALPLSSRGRLEIACLNNAYLNDQNLAVELLGRGFAWFDVGAHDSLIDASQFVQTVQQRQGYQIACLEEIAFKSQWIEVESLLAQSELMGKNAYGRYLRSLIGGGFDSRC